MKGLSLKMQRETPSGGVSRSGVAGLAPSSCRRVVQKGVPYPFEEGAKGPRTDEAGWFAQMGKARRVLSTTSMVGGL